MMRRLLSVLLLIATLPGTLLRDPPMTPDNSGRFAIAPLPLPPALRRHAMLGPLRLDGAWLLTSPDSRFGGYSGLLADADGTLTAIGDGADWLRIAPDGSGQFGTLRRKRREGMPGRDSEAVTRDPATGTVWVAWEVSNAVSRHDAALHREAVIRPPAMAGWPGQTGAEAMVRLADGRFLILSEAREGESGRHLGLIFPGDPTLGAKRGGAPAAFTFAGPEGYRPTDMAQLPDGRVLVLLRQLTWPLPARFSCRLALADPADLRPGGIWRVREIARFDDPLPVDNFEAMALVPQPKGQVALWLLSDDNASQFQRTLLLRLLLNPKSL